MFVMGFCNLGRSKAGRFIMARLGAVSVRQHPARKQNFDTSAGQGALIQNPEGPALAFGNPLHGCQPVAMGVCKQRNIALSGVTGFRHPWPII